MTEQQQLKEQTEQSLLRQYPNIDILCSATRASVLAEIVERKDMLYNYPSPTIEELNKIYHDSAAYEKLLKRCITYVYILKENQTPSDTTIRIHASNFYIACKKNTVNQLLCFIAEFPSMKQYSRGFDYSNFAARFKEYCTEWIAIQNKLLEAKYQEENRLAELRQGNSTGAENATAYLKEIYAKSVDITKGSLYKRNEACKKIIDGIVGDTNTSNEEATEDFYQFQKEQVEIRERRKRLPVWLLTKEEIKEFSEESNKPF